MVLAVRDGSVTRDALQRRATDLLPVLKARAARTEDLRQLPPETVQDLIDSGLIRIGNPQRYGGLDVGYDMAFEMAWELGRACGATAWCYGLWTVHNWWVGHFPAEAQEAFFADGPDVLASSALNPTGGQAEPVAGGFRLSGRWQFSSGCDASSWVMVAAFHPPGMRWFLLPRSDYDIIDTWFVSGMRGTGSKDIEVRDIFVPTYRTLDPDQAGNGEWTGWELHQCPSYRVPLRCLTGWDLVAPVIGMAQGAVDAFTERFADTSGPGRTADSVLVQVRLAEAAVEVDAARELHRRAIGEILRKAEVGETFTPLERARYMRDKTYVGKLCVQAVNRIFDASGGNAILDSEPLQRFHRDVHAASHHKGVDWDAAAENFGRQTLGLPPLPGRFG